jgi:hypothetical protein
MKLIRLLNLKISGIGDVYLNILKFGTRSQIDRADFKRLVRLKKIVTENPNGIGMFSKAEMEELIRKKALK